MSHQIVETMFKVMEWGNDSMAYIECPGKHLHTGKAKKTDCRLNLDNAPTIYCLHTSCSKVIEASNYNLRKALYDNKPLPKREMTQGEKLKLKEMDEAKKIQKEYIAKAENHKNLILEKYHWPVADVFHESPLMTDCTSKDSVAFVRSMFKPEDVIWNGDVMDSGKEANRKNFKTSKEWIQEGIKGNFTCACTFKPDSFSRSNENVLTRPYLVVESDILTADQTCSLFKWLRRVMELKAIVYTGGKSVHGWFKFPEAKLFEELKLTLPKMECDPALFKPSQPVRMPGIKRGDKMQCLYYFNP